MVTRTPPATRATATAAAAAAAGHACLEPATGVTSLSVRLRGRRRQSRAAAGGGTDYAATGCFVSAVVVAAGPSVVPGSVAPGTGLRRPLRMTTRAVVTHTP